MPRRTIAYYVLAALAQERRTIVGDWRFRVVYLHVAFEHSFALPDLRRAKTLIAKLRFDGDIEDIPNVQGVYRVTAPYAATLAAPDEAVVQEANPLAVLSHFTAAAYHELTDVIPKPIYATNHTDNGIRQPLGTNPEDWTGVQRPPRRVPKKVNATQVIWSETKREWDFGHMIGYVLGYPIYITDLERTLLDVIRFPDKCGGIREVLRIWRSAVDQLNLDRLVQYVDRFGQAILRQRAGFLLEQLGLKHTAFDRWAEKSVRGSSAKLVSNLEFSPHHCQRWNLSLNLPDSVLSELQAPDIA